jgi:hypothetical protein
MPKALITATWDDVPHLSAEWKKSFLADLPAHERAARSRGEPTLGSGLIFPIEDEDLYDDMALSEFPSYWARLVGLDFGWDHPFAAAWMAWDRDADCVHVYDLYRARQQSAPIHAAAIRSRGAWIPAAWPHDGLQHDKGSGEALADQFRDLGVNMTSERAGYRIATSDGVKINNSVEAGLQDMLTRMQTGRLKVQKHLKEFFEEKRTYHRKDGKVVKVRDDSISAIRTGIMMLPEAITEEVHSPKIRRASSWKTL